MVAASSIRIQRNFYVYKFLRTIHPSGLHLGCMFVTLIMCIPTRVKTLLNCQVFANYNGNCNVTKSKILVPI